MLAEKLHCQFHAAFSLYLLPVPNNTNKHLTDKTAIKCFLVDSFL